MLREIGLYIGNGILLPYPTKTLLRGAPHSQVLNKSLYIGNGIPLPTLLRLCCVALCTDKFRKIAHGLLEFKNEVEEPTQSAAY